MVLKLCHLYSKIHCLKFHFNDCQLLGGTQIVIKYFFFFQESLLTILRMRVPPDSWQLPRVHLEMRMGITGFEFTRSMFERPIRILLSWCFRGTMAPKESSKTPYSEEVIQQGQAEEATLSMARSWKMNFIQTSNSQALEFLHKINVGSDRKGSQFAVSPSSHTVAWWETSFWPRSRNGWNSQDLLWTMWRWIRHPIWTDLLLSWVHHVFWGDLSKSPSRWPRAIYHSKLHLGLANHRVNEVWGLGWVGNGKCILTRCLFSSPWPLEWQIICRRVHTWPFTGHCSLTVIHTVPTSASALIHFQWNKADCHFTVSLVKFHQISSYGDLDSVLYHSLWWLTVTESQTK